MGFSFRIFVSVFIFLLSFNAFSAADSLRVEQDGGKYYVIHQVEKGETLYSLTRRYKSNLTDVVRANGLVDNQISLGQELRIPIDNYTPSSKPASNTTTKEDKPNSSRVSKHVVVAGETLYAVSRKYGVSVDELKRLNHLTSNEISIGQELLIGSQSSNSTASNKTEEKSSQKSNSEKAEENVPKGFSLYYVQRGDLLESIATKYGVKPDSIVVWNELPNTYLSIGQKLLIKGKVSNEQLMKKENVEELSYGQRRLVKDQSGFVKVVEEGIARKIEDVDTKKYLALHRTLPVGTLIEIRNLMNNQKIFVRVVGKLPSTGLNENVLIRLTPICFERLGIIDPKTRVEVSYYQD